MGWRLAWYAVRGKDRNAVLRDLDLHDTGRRVDVADYAMCGLAVPGWYVVVRNLSYLPQGGGPSRRQSPLPAATLALLSRGAEVAVREHNDTAMTVLGSVWRNGAEVWCADYAAERGYTAVETRGDLPPSYPDVLAANRDEPNWAQIPQTLVAEVVDFAPWDGRPKSYEVLGRGARAAVPADGGRRVQAAVRARLDGTSNGLLEAVLVAAISREEGLPAPSVVEVLRGMEARGEVRKRGTRWVTA